MDAYAENSNKINTLGSGNMTIFELWVKGCEINHTDLWCLDGNGDTGLYKLQSKHMVGWNDQYDTPVYHVWFHGNRIAATTNYSSALAAWHNHKINI